MLAAYPKQVRLVFQEYPLPFHDKAQKAAEAAECANAQGKFWVLHDRMFAHQDQLEVADLKKAAREVGLDGAKFDACLDGGQTADVVKRSVDAGQAAGVQGTPHFVINGRSISGALPLDEFKKVIDRELAARK